MAARRRNLQRPLGGFLTLDILKFQEKLFLDNLPMLRRRKNLISLEMINQGQQIGRGQHLQITRPRRLGTRRGRTDDIPVFAYGGDSGGQHPAYRIAAAVQRQFPQHIIFLQLIGWKDTHRRQDPQRNRKVIMRALFRQVRGRKVDRYTFRRQPDAKGGERGTHPFLTLRNGFIGKADDGECREP